jgi:hypothetical protein
MNERPGNTAQQLYGTGEGARLYEAVWSAAKSDGRTALSILVGLYVEMSARIVQHEVHSSQHDASFAAFCQVAGNRLLDLARVGTGPSPQTMGATVAQQLRNRFEVVSLTESSSPDDTTDDMG